MPMGLKARMEAPLSLNYFFKRRRVLLFRSIFALVMPMALPPLSAAGKTIRYELTATRAEANLSGKKTVSFALMLNGSIPAPTLLFTEGDTAEVLVKNQIPDEEVSVHWHGILLPPEMDGVPYVTTPPIKSGSSHLFRFDLRQSGTYWYHSHTNVQEQKGLYGAIVIQPKNPALSYDKEAVLVLSDWSDEDALDILKNLHKDGDYYLYKKKTVRSWWGALKAGQLGTYADNEWTRMGGMDYSDVGYDAFLINGKRDSQAIAAKKGEKVRLRIINASASTYFNLSLAKQNMRIISADGIDVKPVLARSILIGMAETYDVLFDLPEEKNYEVRATAQDGTGYVSAWIGDGPKASAEDIPAPDLYAPMMMDHSTHSGGTIDHSSHQAGMDMTKPMDHSTHQGHQMHSETEEDKTPVAVLGVDHLQATTPRSYPKDAPVHDVKLVLDGDMSRYIWHINGKAIHEERTIIINEGELVRFTFQNKTMMHHPMHLHGHFFRVVNSHGDFSPIKHTVDVGPHMTRVIEFYADEPGEWMLHCHNLYHLKTGMGRIVKYSTYTPSAELQALQHHDPHHHDHTYFHGRTTLASNHGEAYARLSQTWDQMDVRVETANPSGKHFDYTGTWNYEADVFYHRWLDQNTNLIAGGTLFDEEASGVIGAAYRLPFLIDSTALVSHRGTFRVDLEKEVQWTSLVQSELGLRWRSGVAKSERLDADATLMLRPAWSWAAGLVYKDYRWSAAAEFYF